MARLICVMGESGSGKTTSLRNLDPEHTYIVDADKKGLGWRGWKRSFSPDARNYFACDDYRTLLPHKESVDGHVDEVPGLLDVIDAGKTTNRVDVLVVDTLNGLMVADEARRRKERGYDKWEDLAWSVWGVIDRALTMRDDLTVVFTAHTQTERDESGFTSTRIKTSGKKLDKIVLESKFTTVLLCTVVDGEHVFVTERENTTAKAPIGALPKQLPNDIVPVIKALEAYESGEEE